jgi:hypothetical protein
LILLSPDVLLLSVTIKEVADLHDSSGAESGPEAFHVGAETNHRIRAGKVGGNDGSFELGDSRRERGEVSLSATPAAPALRKDWKGDERKGEEQR